MSLAAIDWALRDADVQRTVFGPARAVLFVLADHASDAAEVWCSQATIVLESGYSDGTVKNALRSLEQLGVVEALGYRQRARLRRLVLPQDPTTSAAPADVTSAAPADVTSAARADVTATSAPPRHDLGSTSAAPADEPEPEPEPLSGEIPPSSPATGGEISQPDPFEDLSTGARALAGELRDLVVARRQPRHSDLCDLADVAEFLERKGVTSAAAFVDAAIDKRPRSLNDNASQILSSMRGASSGDRWRTMTDNGLAERTERRREIIEGRA